MRPMTIINPHEFSPSLPPDVALLLPWELHECSICGENEAHPLHWPAEMFAYLNRLAQPADNAPLPCR